MVARVLGELAAQGLRTVSCTRIGAELNLDPTQVRKDLAVTGVAGRPRIGYDLTQLLSGIGHFLGWDRETNAVVAGAGNLGTALLGHEAFRSVGLRIVAACDTCPWKIGRIIHGRPVWHLRNLPDLAPALRVEILLLAVPVEAAQDVALLAVDSGITAIWNFTNSQLFTPPHVIVERADLSSSLAALTSRLQRAAFTQAPGDSCQGGT
jgi:redox-sensing transcriptional repressor